MDTDPDLDPERQRLAAQRRGEANWRLWGPYLAERAWGTVREDYSADGQAWASFDHDQARARAYRWNEDGLGGICDEGQRLCLALALWNGCDPFLKERAFGLAGHQGNHGEDVKECYFYLDATPSHAWLRYLYKYPQASFPYEQLVAENARRSRKDPPFVLADTGVFGGGRYWDVEVCYAKANPTEIHVRIAATNRGPAAATLHVLPTLWFRNTWSWNPGAPRPKLAQTTAPKGANWAVQAHHDTMGTYCLYGSHPAQTLFTGNDSNAEKLWGTSNATPFVKDAFHRRVVEGRTDATNPALWGTKMAAWHVVTAAAGQTTQIGLTLCCGPRAEPFAQREVILARRQAEARVFYDQLLPRASAQDHNILRQALAGLIWSKQFYHYDVARWLDGDQFAPPAARRRGRNAKWRHLRAHHVISMPDKWEYPWFAAWDLAFHCAALALVDVDFAKDQVELLLKEYYFHPNGQIPAYEWAFGDVNPPVLAMAALKVFRADRIQRGKPDRGFLQRVLNKLLMNFTWWLNRKDEQGHNVFEGGFLGLDNISVYNRSEALPGGYTLKQADATGWMAMFALNMTVMALELAAEDADYEDVAIQCYVQFLGVANTIAGYADPHGHGLSLWDTEDGFFKDLVLAPDGSRQRIDVFSWVGVIPLFACEIVDQRLLASAPRFAAMLNEHGGGLFDGHTICQCPAHVNERGEHLLALVDHAMLPRLLQRLLDEGEFLSRYGIRSLSRRHAERQDLGHLAGIGQAIIDYEPGESQSGLFGGNSNWRGPIWLPTNYCLIQALEKYHRYLGDGFKVEVPCMDHRALTLKEIAGRLSERLVDLFRRDGRGRVPCLGDNPFITDPAGRELLLFPEYFHAETGLGLGAMHQTGWTALVANLVIRKYRDSIPAYWQEYANDRDHQQADEH